MIFLSYCQKEKKEKKLINYIYDSLNNFDEYRGKIFLDEKNLKYGNAYWKDIYLTIEKCDFFVFLNSKSYLNSSTCWKEIHIAIEKYMIGKIKIIEIKMGEAKTHSCIPSDNLYITYVSEVITVQKLKDTLSGNELIIKTSNKFFEEKKEIFRILEKLELGKGGKSLEEFSEKIIDFMINELKIISEIPLSNKMDYFSQKIKSNNYKINSYIDKITLDKYKIWLGE